MSEKFQLFTSLRYDPALGDANNAISSDVGWNSRKSSPFYMLDYHRDRMLNAARHWGWTKAVEAIDGDQGLEKLESFLLQNIPQPALVPLRVKILLSKEGDLGLETSEVPQRPIANLFPTEIPPPGDIQDGKSPFGVLERTPAWEVAVDIKLTHRSEYTHYKTTERAMYDDARQRASIKLADKREVLIINEEDNTIMEGSTTTPYFWRGDRWVTPPVSKKFTRDVGSGGQDGTSRRWALERGLAVEEEVNTESLMGGEDVWLSNGVRGFIYGRLSLR